MADQHKVLRTSDGRVIDFAFGDTGFADPPRLTAKQAANAGSVIETFDGDLPDNIQRGFAIDTAGAVSPPATETTNEQLEARQALVRDHILATVGSRGFSAYRALSTEHERRAAIYEATRRAMWQRVLVPSVVANNQQWGIIAAMVAPFWRDVAAALDFTSWDNGNDLALVLLLRDGAAWRTPTLNATSMLYEATQEGGAAQWPTGFTVGAEAQAEYERVLASV